MRNMAKNENQIGLKYMAAKVGVNDLIINTPLCTTNAPEKINTLVIS